MRPFIKIDGQTLVTRVAHAANRVGCPAVIADGESPCLTASGS